VPFFVGSLGWYWISKLGIAIGSKYGLLRKRIPILGPMVWSGITPDFLLGHQVSDLFLQKRQSIRSIQCLGTLYNNRSNVKSQAIYKACSIIEHVDVWIISLELIYQGRESLDIIKDCGLLVDVEHAPNQNLVLITTKTFMQHATKGRPIKRIEHGFDRLNPQGSMVFELLFGDFEPQVGFDLVHIKVVFGIGDPQPDVLTVKGRERKLGHTPSVMQMRIGWFVASDIQIICSTMEFRG
jgi:hypothetical protein